MAENIIPDDALVLGTIPANIVYELERVVAANNGTMKDAGRL